MKTDEVRGRSKDDRILAWVPRSMGNDWNKELSFPSH